MAPAVGDHILNESEQSPALSQPGCGASSESDDLPQEKIKLIIGTIFRRLLPIKAFLLIAIKISYYR
jgi:hypothetical protein